MENEETAKAGKPIEETVAVEDDQGSSRGHYHPPTFEERCREFAQATMFRREFMQDGSVVVKCVWEEYND